MNVFKYNKFNFISENMQEHLIKESSEFGDMQMGQSASPLGPGFGQATDPTMSVYSDGSSPYVDNYERMSLIVKDLTRVMKGLYNSGSLSISKHKLDYFLEDIDEYSDLKILRIFPNTKLTIDIFISFNFMDEEFFGVYRDYNGLNKPKLQTDLFTDPRFRYIDTEYKLKLSNYFSKILFNWFIPSVGDYLILSDELKVKDTMGNNVIMKKGTSITIKGYNNDINNQPFLIIKKEPEMYKLLGNDFFFFKYWCKKI